MVRLSAERHVASHRAITAMFAALTFAVPVQAFRAGFFLSDRMSLEPSVGLNYVKLEDVDAFYTLEGNLGLLHALEKFDADKGVFLENQAVLARDGKIAAIGAAAIGSSRAMVPASAGAA